MSYEAMGKPCRNWCFFESEYIPCDPRDGKEKIALSSCVAGGKGRIVIMDPLGGTGEYYDLPDEIAAWGMIYLPDYETLLVGTCPNHAYVYRLDLKTRTWSEPAELPGEKYFWNMVRGKDGKVYGSNWPNNILLRYDPATHTLDSAGRLGDDPLNQYSRYCYVHPNGNIINTAGCHVYRPYYYDIDTETMTPFGVDGDQIVDVTKDLLISKTPNDGLWRFYDPDTFALIDKPVSQKELSLDGLTDPRVIAYVKELIDPSPERKYCGTKHCYTLSDGSTFGISGQEYVLLKDGEVTYHTIPVEAPPTEIFQIAEDKDGIIWFATGLGQTFGWYNPETGAYWNSPQASPYGGEIYGMQFINDLLYMTAYSYGIHILYDPKKPWDMHGQVNPRDLLHEGTVICRPIGRSVVGSDGNLWTGWGKPYGQWGGGITRIDTKTNEVTIWMDQIEEQSVCDVAAGKNHMFASTSGQASGRASKQDAFWFLKLDMDCNIVWKEQFVLGQFPGDITVLNGKVYLVMVDENNDTSSVRVYDEETMELLCEQVVGDSKWETRLRNLQNYDETRLLMIVGTEARLVNAATLAVENTETLPCLSPIYTIGHDKWIWFGHHTELMRFRFEPK